MFSPLEGHMLELSLSWLVWEMISKIRLQDVWIPELLPACFVLRIVLQGYVFSLSSTASGIAQ